jgi:hypothetical protein
MTPQLAPSRGQPIAVCHSGASCSALGSLPLAVVMPRQTVTALIVANEFLEAQVRELQATVSNGYARGKFEPVPPDRKDWYD